MFGLLYCLFLRLLLFFKRDFLLGFGLEVETFLLAKLPQLHILFVELVIDFVGGVEEELFSLGSVSETTTTVFWLGRHL